MKHLWTAAKKYIAQYKKTGIVWPNIMYGDPPGSSKLDANFKPLIAVPTPELALKHQKEIAKCFGTGKLYLPGSLVKPFVEQMQRIFPDKKLTVTQVQPVRRPKLNLAIAMTRLGRILAFQVNNNQSSFIFSHNPSKLEIAYTDIQIAFLIFVDKLHWHNIITQEQLSDILS